jgi:hypothetical protein
MDQHLVLTGYDHLEALPVWADVTARVGGGPIAVTALVRSIWRPVLFAQMRVEYVDGSSEDFATGSGWECLADPSGIWGPAADAGGYHREPGGGFWGHEFALLPRELLRERLDEHNRRLRADFAADTDVALILDTAPERSEWADQFQGFCRVDDRTGQLLDGAGRVRHLFFTIYNQVTPSGTALSLPEFDLDQLERDLDLMADAGVNLYMRQTGWDWLLTADGEWAPLDKQPGGSGLPHFARGIDLLDHLVRRAHAHGRYIVFEGDFYWGAHSAVVPPPYRSRYHLYPEVLEAQALAMRKVMCHLSACPNVLGMMIGEEDILLAHDLRNPHQHALFADFLRRKYGTLEEFRRQTPRGHDYADHSAFRPAERKSEYFADAEPEPVLIPSFPLRDGVFDRAREWLDIPLPLWPEFRSSEAPEVVLADQKSYNEFTPEDPLWMDFYEMREDELLFGMLSRWAQIVRQGMPRQLLFYSNAQDFTNSWHFLHLYRRADLPFDVIGVGCHDSGFNLAEIRPEDTVRKAIKVIASYRPYALAPGSPARGVASGEGEGGRHDQPEEVLDYYRGALFDEIGGGAAWTQTYTWTHISGAGGTEPPQETPLLAWMRDFMPTVQGVEFPLRRPVQVLIVRNANLQHSNLSGLDYGNAMQVAEALTQLNVEFDIVMDRDLIWGRHDLKTDVAPYRLVIVPSLAADLAPSAWDALSAWLGDKGPGRRVLAIGWAGRRGNRLQPLDGFPEAFARLTGVSDYSGTVSLRGPQPLVLRQEGERADLTVDFGNGLPAGTFAEGQPLLESADGTPIGVLLQPVGVDGPRTNVSRQTFRTGDTEKLICALGFPLGLNSNELWNLAPQQNPRDALVPLYEALAGIAGVDRPILAPHNLRVYLSEGGRMVLIRERAGLPTDAEVRLRLPREVRFADLQPARDGDGYARLHVALKPWEARWWKAE